MRVEVLQLSKRIFEGFELVLFTFNQKSHSILGDGSDLLGDGANLLGDFGNLLGDGGDLLGDGGDLLGDGSDLLGDGGKKCDGPTYEPISDMGTCWRCLCI